MFKRCATCNKLMIINHNKYSDNYYCGLCLEKKKAEDEEERKRKQAEDLRRKQERARIKDEIANRKLKEELEREEKERQAKKSKKKESKKPKETEPNQTDKKSAPKPYRPRSFDQQTIDSYSRLLYIEADVKHIKVIDWRDGKKKLMLNKNREIRRTHAGGFSAEKFQRFVDAKKQKTFEWIVEELEKPGILRPPYDKIKVESRDEDLKKEIQDHVGRYLQDDQ